jgi:hypothetical protein
MESPDKNREFQGTSQGSDKSLIHIRFLAAQLKVAMSDGAGKPGFLEEMSHNNRIDPAADCKQDPVFRAAEFLF